MSLLKNSVVPISQKRAKLMGLLSKAEDLLVHPVSTRTPRLNTSTSSSFYSNSPSPRVQYPAPEVKGGRGSGMSLHSLFDRHAHLVYSQANKLKDSGHPVLSIARYITLATPYCIGSSMQAFVFYLYQL